MKIRLVILVTLISLLFSSSLSLAQQVEGQIVAVNEKEEVILLRGQTGLKEYKLAGESAISLNQKKVQLTALHPIDYKSFCAARINLDQTGRVNKIDAVYRTLEIRVINLKDKELIVEKIATGAEYEFELASRIKVIRNNLASEIKDIKPGDRGLVIFGLDNQLKKIILSNYQRCGIIKKIDKQKKRIVLNTGTRLRPHYETFSLSEQTKIKFGQQEVEFERLRRQLWVKVVGSNPVQQLVTRKI